MMGRAARRRGEMSAPPCRCCSADMDGAAVFGLPFPTHSSGASCPCRWKLYLADWGYNTAEERAAAARLPGVRLLSRPQFVELLRWGVVMEASV